MAMMDSQRSCGYEGWKAKSMAQVQTGILMACREVIARDKAGLRARKVFSARFECYPYARVSFSLRMRSGIGGCVLSRFHTLFPRSGLTMNMCAEAGFAFIGARCAAASSLASAPARP